ncbi:MAG: glycosyltransferase family 39 protein [Candidatus Omnitrophota bacterium]
MFKNSKDPVNECCNRSALIVAGVFVISFLLRIYGLGAKDFWFDEIHSVSLAIYPWNNWNAPLYWIVLHFWVKAFGVSEFCLRLPSMLFSFLATVIVFMLGKELFDKKTAILATLLIGLSSFHLWYAQEARDYSMVLLLGTVSSYLLLIATKKSTFKRWLWFSIVSSAGIYTNYFYIFLISAQALYALSLTRYRANKAWWCFLFIAGISGFYLPRFISKLMFVSQGFWLKKPDWQSLNITLQNYVLGYNGTAVLYALSSLLTVIIFMILFAVVMKKRDMRRSVYFCGLLLFIPLALVFLFSKLFFSVYLSRGLLLFSPYFYLLLSCAVMGLSRGIRAVAAGVLISIFLCGTWLYFYGYIYPPGRYHSGACLKKPVRPLAGYLDNNVRSGDLVAFTNVSVMPGLNFYSKRMIPQYYLFSPQVLNSDWQRPVTETRFCVPIHKIGGLAFKRIWVICLDWERSGKLDENSVAVKRSLDSDLKLLFEGYLDGLWVYCYERNSSGKGVPVDHARSALREYRLNNS